MAIWEFTHLSDEDLSDAIEHINALTEIFGECPVDDDMYTELHAELSKREDMIMRTKD